MIGRVVGMVRQRAGGRGGQEGRAYIPSGIDILKANAGNNSIKITHDTVLPQTKPQDAKEMLAPATSKKVKGNNIRVTHT